MTVSSIIRETITRHSNSSIDIVAVKNYIDAVNNNIGAMNNNIGAMNNNIGAVKRRNSVKHL